MKYNPKAHSEGGKGLLINMVLFFPSCSDVPKENVVILFYMHANIGKEDMCSKKYNSCSS